MGKILIVIGGFAALVLVVGVLTRMPSAPQGNAPVIGASARTPSMPQSNAPTDWRVPINAQGNAHDNAVRTCEVYRDTVVKPSQWGPAAAKVPSENAFHECMVSRGFPNG